MSELLTKQERRIRRINRVRSKLLENGGKLRISVFASNKHLYAQIIDDAKGVTLVSVSASEVKAVKGSKSDIAASLGTLLAQKAQSAKIGNNLVFDKGRYKYHGRVKAFADAARAGGLKF